MREEGDKGSGKKGMQSAGGPGRGSRGGRTEGPSVPGGRSCRSTCANERFKPAPARGPQAQGKALKHELRVQRVTSNVSETGFMTSRCRCFPGSGSRVLARLSRTWGWRKHPTRPRPPFTVGNRREIQHTDQRRIPQATAKRLQIEGFP